MKNLALTKSHKSKLLEMCKVLFPEYDKIWFLDEEYSDTTRIVFGKSYKRNTIVNNIHLNKGCIIGIPDSFHWFEFCMTYLANKIYYPDIENIQRDARYNLQGFFFSTFMEAIEGGVAGYEHPIDYLYTHFKKLKK